MGSRKEPEVNDNAPKDDSELTPAELRARLVTYLVREGAIKSLQLERAFAEVPREIFLPADIPLARVYSDEAIVVKWDEQNHPSSSSTQPFLMADMLEILRLEPDMRVLEIGAGSGYQTALLAELASQVFAVERYASLAETAQKTLERLGYRNAKIVTGDGSLGLAEAAPFDAIIVSAAAPRIPQALMDQLAVGGRLLIPVGEADQQVLQLIQRNADGSISVRMLEGCRFVPLIGEQGFVA